LFVFGNEEVWVMDTKRDPDRSGKDAWLYLGASGVLQPLSAEFLYRSPSESPKRCRSCRLVARQDRQHAKP
jgi:hypothetical protein